jgi:hypothetical protein
MKSGETPSGASIASTREAWVLWSLCLQIPSLQLLAREHSFPWANLPFCTLPTCTIFPQPSNFLLLDMQLTKKKVIGILLMLRLAVRAQLVIPNTTDTVLSSAESGNGHDLGSFVIFGLKPEAVCARKPFRYREMIFDKLDSSGIRRRSLLQLVSLYSIWANAATSRLPMPCSVKRVGHRLHEIHDRLLNRSIFLQPGKLYEGESMCEEFQIYKGKVRDMRLQAPTNSGGR